MRSWSVALLGALPLVACGGEELVPIPEIEVHGVAIDGSEDPRPERVAPVDVDANVPVDVSVDVNVPASVSEGTDGAVVSDGSAAGTGTSTLTDADADADAGALTFTDTGTGEPAVAPEPEPEVQDGPLTLTYQDLSLIDYDVDAMLDYMLFPEEYEGEDTSFLELPKDLKALDGKQITLVGYMIPGEIQRGNVRDFMLVRDLMGCCFGGTPMPDEWVDVTMDEDAEAEYRPYLPMRVTGTLSLGGEQDEAGFALGIYRMQASEVIVED